MSDELFVGINDANNFRKNILTCSKDCLETLRTAEKVKQIKKEKLHLSAELKKDLDQLARVMNKLKSAMPKAQVKTNMPKPVKVVVKKEVVEKKESPKKKKSHLDILEDQLSKIEEKLSSLE